VQLSEFDIAPSRKLEAKYALGQPGGTIQVRQACRRRYVYNHSTCGRCGSKVSTWDMNARKVYACETCQPLHEDTVITPARAQALRAGRPTKVLSTLAGAASAICCTPSCAQHDDATSCIVETGRAAMFMHLQLNLPFLGC